MSAIQAVTFSQELASLPAHTHRNVHQIVFVLSGALDISIGSCRYHVNRPSAVFISHLEPHAISVQSQHYQRFCIDIHPDEIERDIKSARLLSILSNRPDTFRHVLDIEPLLPVLRPFLEELNTLFHCEDDEFAKTATALLRSILIILFRHAPDTFPFEENSISGTVEQIKRRIEQNLSKDETLDELAAHFHISRYYLAHCYKQITGYSIKNYRMLCRIAEARDLLASTSLSVTEICEQIGFSGLSNFSRYFKKEVGMSPIEYRTLHRHTEIKKENSI